MPDEKMIHCRMRLPRSLVHCFIVAALVCPAMVRASENLVENGGFETDALGNLTMWSMNAATDSEDAVRFFSTDADAHSGARSFAIANLKPNDAWAVQWVKTRPNTLYRLSCWIQARDVVSENVGANISVLGSSRAAGDLKDTNGQWQRVEMYGRTGPDQHSLGVLVRLGFYQGRATGLALFDDVTLEESPALPAGSQQDIVSFSVNEYRTDTVVAERKVAVQRSARRVPVWLFAATSAALAAAAALFAFGALQARRGASPVSGGPPSGVYGGVEHRSSPRSVLAAEVTLKRPRIGGLAEVFHFQGGNISGGGIYLEHGDPSVLKLNQEVRLEIILPTSKLALGNAVVTRVRPRYSRAGKLMATGFGFKFLTSSAWQLKERKKAAALPASTRGRRM
jgi:hypothetical protein